MSTHWRQIIIDGKTYRYRAGSYFVAQDESGKRIAEGHMHQVKGLDPQTFERGQWKGTEDGQVYPSDVRRFIQSSIAARQEASS